MLVPIVIRDPSTARAYRFLNTETPRLAISDFAAAEFASAVARRVRMNEVTTESARRAFVALDALATRVAVWAETSAIDVRRAEEFVRRLDLPLRAPDALHIAIVERIGAALMTFDDKMAQAATRLGMEVAAA